MHADGPVGVRVRGRRRPVELKDSDFVVDVDVVIPAIGQSWILAPSGQRGCGSDEGGTMARIPTHGRPTCRGLRGWRRGTGPWTVVGASPRAAIGRQWRSTATCTGRADSGEAPTGSALDEASGGCQAPYEIIEDKAAPAGHARAGGRGAERQLQGSRARIHSGDGDGRGETLPAL